MTFKNKFEKFYQENIDKIYRFVFFRIGQNKELAEDLVSEIFLKALKNFDNYDEQISRSAWIFTIAKNTLANYWRDNKKIEILEIDTAEISSAEGNLVEEEWLKLAMTNYNQMQLKHEIYDILAKLDNETRDLVTLHYLVGYSYTEIAELKGRTEIAIKVAVHRAIKNIRKSL